MKKSLKWIKRYMRIAREVSYWSKDPSSKIGAVIVSETGRILATGYNGFPEKMEDNPSDYENREFKYKRIIHAEENALLNALKYSVNIQNSSIFVYNLPICSNCARLIAQSGISEIYLCYNDNNITRWKESFDISKSIFKECNIKITRIQEKDLEDL